MADVTVVGSVQALLDRKQALIAELSEINQQLSNVAALASGKQPKVPKQRAGRKKRGLPAGAAASALAAPPETGTEK